MQKFMRKGSKIIAFFVALIMTSFVCIDASFFTIEASAQTVYSADDIVEDMGLGWNLGNSLDATGDGGANGQETSWGNPWVTEDLIKAVKAKGFNTVRVPVSWYKNITVENGKYTINADWFARVKEVVDYAYNNGMYVILNIHHEDWINRTDLASSYSVMSTELKQVWTQIAEYFADYDQHLIFEGMNEPRMAGAKDGEWTGNSACYEVINKLDADFISTVRSVDSAYKNTRLLMVPGYAASGDYGIYSNLDKNLFNDPYVAASVHAYKPYSFAMGDGDHSSFSSDCKAELDGVFNDLRSFFTQDGIPVVIGEFSTSNYGYTNARVDWAEYYMTLAKEIGIACVLWDNNVEKENGGEAHGYINRINNTWYSVSEPVVDKLLSVRNDSSIVWASKSSFPLYAHKDYTSGTSVSVGSDGNIKVSELKDFASGKELAVKYSSQTAPKFALMNVGWSGWTELSAYDYSYSNSGNIAYLRYDDIYSAWNSSANGDIYVININNYDKISFISAVMLDVSTSEVHKHTLEKKYSSDATGHWHKCTTCNEKVDFAAHISDNGTVTKQPTETTEGEKTYKCTVCGYVIRTEPIAKLDHKHVLDTNWTSDASGHWHNCTGCSEKVDFAAHISDNGTVTKKPTEQTEGEKTYKCTVCGYVIRTEPIAKLDHKHVLDTNWSSDATGHWHNCTGCSEKVDFAAHTEDNGTVTKQPTMTEEGEKTYKCKVCEYVIRTEAVPKLSDSAVAVYDGTETKTFDDLDTTLKAYKTTTKALTITLNKDANVKTLSLPTKAESITFTGTGALNVSGTSITIPANTTFDVEVNGKGKTLAVRVSKDKTLSINKATSNIGAVSGTRTSILNVNEDAEALSIATFGTVNVEDGKTLTVTSRLSAVTSLNGAVKLPTSKTTAATVTAGNAEIILTDGNIAKVTLADVTNKLNVKVVDENGETTDLASGTIVLYSTKDISEKVTVENTTADQKELNAFYYKKNKAVKAEWADAVTLYNGETSRNFPNVELVLANITDKNTDYTITLNTDVTEPRFILPKTAKSITINGTGSLTTAVTNIAVPVDTTIGCEIKQSAGKAIALRSAANTTLTLSAENSFGAVSGTRTSTLVISEDAEALSIATFGTVNVEDGKTLTVTSRLSAVTSLNGAVKLPTAKTTAATVTAGNAEIILTNDDIAKVTLADVTNKLNVKVVDENNEAVKLASGTIVLYSTKDISEKTTIENITNDDKELNAFYYKKNKAIKAEWADAITLSYSDTSRKFPNMELALESITDKNTDYTITLNTDITASTFALPAAARSVTIKSENEAKTITLTNITSVSAKTPLKLENIKLESTKPYTISTTSDLTLDRFASDSITAVRGGAKATLTLGETTPIDKVSGFGTTKVTSEFRTGTMFTTTDLELAETANLVVSNTKAPATAKTLNGAEGSVITLDAGFTPIKVTGTTADSISGTIKLKATEAIDENTVLFTTKYAGNNVFDVTEIKPQTELDYTVTSISGKAYMKPIVFEMNNTGYALWTDVMTVIENVKMSEAQYTVKLLDDADINGAMKLPKAGTYGKLTISSESKTLTFTGSITATGELEIANTNLVSARNTTSSKYTISAGKYQFAAENADLSLASITSTADVTLKNIRTSGTVRAGKLTLNGENTILGTITANELGSTEEGTVLNILSNTRGVMRITKNGIAENSEEITIKLVDESENAVMAENLSIIASSFTGNYSGELKLSTENGEFSIILSRNKLVLADSFTAANGLLEADEEESDDTDTSEEEPAEETPEDNSDDAPSEEDAPNDEDTSDNDINEETESSDMTEELSA